MFNVRSFLLMVTVTCSLFLIARHSLASFRDLAYRVPEGANAVMVVNVEKLLSSPLGQQEHWREEQERMVDAGLLIVPPSSTEFLMASHIDFETMHPHWEAALAAVSYEPSMVKAAARWGGQIDRIGQRDAVLLPDDTYLVQFGKRMVGTMRPASRQQVARWLRQIDTQSRDERQLSPYLQQAVRYAEDIGTPIILALDTQDILSAEFVRQRLGEAKSLQGLNLDLDQLSEAIASLKGVTLGITVGDRVFGKLKVEFDKDISALGQAAKPLLLEALSNNGAMIDEFEDWTAKVEPNRISIEGYFYKSGMQRIMSLLDAPASFHQHAASVADAESAQSTLLLLSSQHYFKSASSLIDDLASKKGGKTMGQIAMWFGRYASKIDALPILNVDSELLDWGGFTANSLRDAEAALRGAASRTRTREVNAPAQYRYYGRYGYNVGWNWGGGGYVAQEDLQAASQQRARIRTEERLGGAKQVQDIMQQVTQSTADIRRRMTDKYQAEF
jgi:hypothetical protein